VVIGEASPVCGRRREAVAASSHADLRGSRPRHGSDTIAEPKGPVRISGGHLNASGDPAWTRQSLVMRSS